MKRVLTAMETCASHWPSRVKGFSQLRNVASPNSLRSLPRTWAHWLARTESTPGDLTTSSDMAMPSILDPGQARGFPAARLAAMSLSVGVALEAFSYVVTTPITCCRHGLGRGAAAPAAAADEEERCILIGELVGELGGEIRVDLHGREHLPGLQHRAPAERGEVRKPDEHPLGAGAHIDELGVPVLGEELPRCGRVQITGI